MNKQMTPADDMELLREFSQTRSDSAFAALVDRHLDLVHSAAVRQTRDADLAKDVSQAVFLLLAMNAGSLGPGTVLAGWLYRAACFISKDAVKAEYRRRKREQEVMKPEFESHANNLVWEEVALVLDAALQSLNVQDRDAILLRFFEDRNLREVGDALDVSEDAAQKRVSRALEKLKEILRRKGVAASLLGLGGLLFVKGAQAAPFGLKAEAALVATNGGALTAGLADGAAKAMFWSEAKGGILTGLGALAIIGCSVLLLRLEPTTSVPSPRSPSAPVIEPGERAMASTASIPANDATTSVGDTRPAELEVEIHIDESPVAEARLEVVPAMAADRDSIRGSVGGYSEFPRTGVRGRVRLRGTPPPNKKFKMDPYCGRLHKVNVHEMPFHVVGPDRGLKDVVVFVRMAKGGPYPVREPALLDQVDCVFTPYVSALQTGQTLRVRNSDPLMHNVHVTPRNTAGGNKEYNYAQPLQGMTSEFTFTASELFLRIKCDVHQWMFAYVSVFAHPFFAVTDEHGEFEISGLPPGEYILEAVHRKVHQESQAEGYVGKRVEITVRENEALAVELELEAP